MRSPSRPRSSLTSPALRSFAAALCLAAAAACPATQAPSPECVVFLQCFFPGDSTTYPQGAVVDGGVDGSGVPIELSFDSFSDPGVQKLVRDAYGEGGRCWRIEGTSTEISDSCTRACASALADECQRGAAGAALCPDVVVDGGFQAGDQAMTCAQVGAP